MNENICDICDKPLLEDQYSVIVQYPEKISCSHPKGESPSRFIYKPNPSEEDRFTNVEVNFKMSKIPRYFDDKWVFTFMPFLPRNYKAKLIKMRQKMSRGRLKK